MRQLQLGADPQRADLVLIRRPTVDTHATRPLLPRLWQRIRVEAILELKTVSHPVRRGDLARLLGYGAQYLASSDVLLKADDLLLVLVVASITPALQLELTRMQWTLLSPRDGYGTLWGCPFPAMLVVIDDVARSEQDDLLRVFGHDKIQLAETLRWFRSQLAESGDVAMRELEGYDEVMRKFVESLPSETRVAGLPPEERLAGLPEQERVALLAAFPIDFLRALPEAVLLTLPEDVRTAIRRRLDGESHRG